MSLHIHIPEGQYIAQIRGRGCRKWETVGIPCLSAKQAMCEAIRAMEERHKRARVLFDVPWHGPTVVMEAQKP